MKNKATREKFVESMEQIAKQVATSTDDVCHNFHIYLMLFQKVKKLQDKKETNNQLTDQLKVLVEKERNYYKSTREFQEVSRLHLCKVLALLRNAN